ncbi:uncharacterized protein LOC126900246 isoform X2 [Daktulosphaira vitifoliae]|uniref:uncharacterized protein LOC126900246 isoform X2 n=1 Tax=Daktulosphaira vitifoliae TaxID=58002 RepID=UPI0021AABDC9|nr:uncharacterized protein LOC126900246 isoform X2 [Daktulosphaira vitifoliae]XP_050531803.1 uncharacterized protein LOC126900246 isoform X2 [Daktulosphaira vitifoliae]
MKKILLQLLIFPVFLSSTLEIIRTIADNNLTNAKEKLYECFKKKCLFERCRDCDNNGFIEDFDKYVNEEVQNMLLNKFHPANLPFKIYNIYFPKPSEISIQNKELDDTINCVQVFYSHLFATTVPQIETNEEIEEKVRKNWTIACETLYDCFKHYDLHNIIPCSYKIFHEKTFDARINQYREHGGYRMNEEFLTFLDSVKQEIIDKALTSVQINEKLVKYVHEEPPLLTPIEFCSSAFYTRLFM